MRYLLDADTLIDYIQDRGNARPRITAMIEAGDEVALCAVTVAELYTGYERQATCQVGKLAPRAALLADQYDRCYPGWHIPQDCFRVWSNTVNFRLTSRSVST